MLYQYDSDYLFDSTKFLMAFHFTPAGYEMGIAQCAMPMRPQAEADRAGPPP
jgi:hypothetical protein